jgi:hypothetical protein
MFWGGGWGVGGGLLDRTPHYQFYGSTKRFRAVARIFLSTEAKGKYNGAIFFKHT